MTSWLTDTLLYTGVLIAVVLILRRPFSRWFGPQFAYALWALPALRLLLPPVELPAEQEELVQALEDYQAGRLGVIPPDAIMPHVPRSQTGPESA